MIGDKIYYYVGAGLVSLIVIYILIQLFNLHIRVNKSVMEGFSLPGGDKPPGGGKETSSQGSAPNQSVGSDGSTPLQNQHKQIETMINQQLQTINQKGKKEELETYLLDYDELIDLNIINTLTDGDDKNKKKDIPKIMGELLSIKRAIEVGVLYMNSDSNRIGENSV